VWKLTGRYVLDHYSAINTGPLYLAASNEWSDVLAPDLLSLEKLPELLWTTEIAGGVTKAAAEVTGLAVGTPVITGTIDAASEAISVGVLDPGDMLLMYGSTIFIIAPTAGRVRDSPTLVRPMALSRRAGSIRRPRHEWNPEPLVSRTVRSRTRSCCGRDYPRRRS